MNFYNPYFNSFPTMGGIATRSPGLFSRLFGNFNLSSILSGTGKVVNFANQAIPLVKQISPLIKNAKTMFKVMNEFKKVDEPKSFNKGENQNSIKKEVNDDYKTTKDINNLNQNGPVFFI